jgi:hypothetical protein
VRFTHPTFGQRKSRHAQILPIGRLLLAVSSGRVEATFLLPEEVPSHVQADPYR